MKISSLVLIFGAVSINAFLPSPSSFNTVVKASQQRVLLNRLVRSHGFNRYVNLKMTVAEPQEVIIVEPPTASELNSLPMGYAGILNELEEMRTRDIFGAMNKGDISKLEAGTLTLKRMGKKMFGSKQKVDKKSASFMEGGWSKRGKGSSILRTFEIYSFCIKIVLRELKLRKVEDKALKSSTRKEIAADLKQGLLELGPTFIKLGQLLSTRIDILPKEYIDELKQLQDNVPGFSGDKAVQVIEKELGKPINQIFDSFDRTPLAAASLGQVHRAVLKGEEVAVKVQRTGLDALFKNDLQNLKFAAKVFDKLDPKSDGADRDWVSIYEESAKLLYQEIDYRQEATNAERFRTQFQNVEWIKVPRVYLEYSTSRVLVMEYVPSIKISEVEKIEQMGLDRLKLAERSAVSYLEQLSNFGFFHCDPHPGNIGVDNGAPGGRLVYYDFGMMDAIGPDLKRGLVDLILGIYEFDPAIKDTTKSVLSAAETMGILDPNADKVPIERICRYFLCDFYNTQSGNRVWTKDKTKEDQKAERAARRAALGESLLSVGSEVPFRFPPTFTFVFRAFTSLDGIGKGLDPNYDLTKLTVPYLRKLSELKYGSETASLIAGFTEKTGLNRKDVFSVVKTPRNMQYVADTLEKMERGELKIRVRALEAEQRLQRLELLTSSSNSMVLAAGLVNAGLILAAGAGAGPAPLAARALWAAGGLAGAIWVRARVQIAQLDKKLGSYKVKTAKK